MVLMFYLNKFTKYREQIVEILPNGGGLANGITAPAKVQSWMGIFAKNNPKDFLSILNDPNLSLQSNVKSFFSNKLLSFRRDKKEVWFNTPSNKKKMLTIPFGEDPYHVCEQYFLTDEGVESLKSLENYMTA